MFGWLRNKQFDIDLTIVVDNEQKTWTNIFANDVGYVSLRHRIVHQGFRATFKNKSSIDIQLINEALVNIASFVFNVDQQITVKYPQINFKQLYPEAF